MKRETRFPLTTALLSGAVQGTVVGVAIGLILLVAMGMVR